MRASWLRAALALAVSGCRTLPEVPEDTCGNHVIEAGEDCDGYARLGNECRPPGGPGECHLDCSGEIRSKDACPAGFGCDPLGICRQPTGGFEPDPSGTVPGGAWELMSGDFDGDGRTDVVSRGVPGLVGLSELRVHYFDRTGALAETWSTAEPFGNIIVRSLSKDERDDLLITQNGLCAMLGEADRTLTPQPYPSYYLVGSRVVVIPVSDGLVDDETALAIIRQVGSVLELERPDKTPSERLVSVATLEGGLDALAGPPATAHVFEDRQRFPCRELALALRAKKEVRLYQLCERQDTGVLWRDRPLVTTRPLEPPAEPIGSPILADLDGDGHTDVLVAAATEPYAAFSDGEELGPLTPLRAAVAGSDGHLTAPPLAAGDLSGDGIADLIVPETLLIAQKVEGRIQYRIVHPSYRGLWSQALIAHLNGDDQLDAIVTSSSGSNMQFFMGTADDRINPFFIPTLGRVDNLATGDLDGDGIFDLAFVTPDQGPDGDDQISAAYGNAVGPPDLPVPIAHIDGVTGLVALADSEDDAVSNLLVLSDLDVAAPDDALTSTLSLMIGSGERQFFSPVVLTTFSRDGSLEEVEALVATVGHFTSADKTDLVTIAGTDPTPDDDSFDVFPSVWAMPDFSSGFSTPHLLSWDFTAEFAPVNVAAVDAPITVRLTSADLDGNGLDEIVLAAPIGDGRCLLSWAGLENAALRLGPVHTLFLEEGCRNEPLLHVRDIDGDGASDILLLLGQGEDSALHVLYGDGLGNVSSEARTVVADPEGVHAFTLFQLTPNAPLTLAYTTPSAVHWLDVNGQERTFSARGTIGDLVDVTGVTAGDVNGDGVFDLVVAAAGAIRVHPGKLRAP